MDNHSSFFQWGLLFAILCDALNLTLQLKRTFEEGRPISEALSSFVSKREEEKY